MTNDAKSATYLLSVLGERLLLAAVPVLVEPTFDFVRQMCRPNGCQCAEATRSLDISNDTDHHKRGSFDDRNGLDDFPLVHFYNGLRGGSERMIFVAYLSQDGPSHERHGSCLPCSQEWR